MRTDPWLIVRVMRFSHVAKSAIGIKERESTSSETSRMDAWLANLAERGFEGYYPMISELKRVPRRELSHAQRTSSVDLMRHRVVPFLPGLVFVRSVSSWTPLLAVPGVIGMVTIGNEPARIADALIKRLRARAEANGGAIPGATPTEFIFERGDQVRVLNGPFAMFNGTVEDPPSCPVEQIDAETRLRLTVDLFGRATPLEIAVADVAHL